MTRRAANLATLLALAAMAVVAAVLLLAPAAAVAQTIVVGPGPPPTFTPTATPTPTHVMSTTNCTTLRTCSECAAVAACGWCTLLTATHSNASVPGQCIPSFNIFAPPGGSASACYGQLDQYFWMQCSLGARTFSIVAIAGGILALFVVLFLCGCLIRARRRRAQGDTAFTRMVDDFERKYGGHGNNGKDGKKGSVAASGATIRSSKVRAGSPV
ncbi:hypothetical protein AMAG_00745 [Allomyces macrogynus ATCC 38327]|uniref:PSI domain-containing protein n=1 Tax=Allomyces macrogynus (strain ATCC 38327) TaxID=578462 RepID=A0A0L0RXK9_ALLM3|nr:hypothetical protein AMAG_00745 [Allomyces macrogynus ATCC 38327]|eukprot:KNE54791.1 hypothetical protein AMAG_00745 [Allomyces macrogynus ATCC 38327]